MWIASLRLKDDQDIYSPLCHRHGIDFFAYPYASYVKGKQIHLVLGGMLSGSESAKEAFLAELKKHKKVASVERRNDFILVHAVHPLSRESEAVIEIYYSPKFIKLKPDKISRDGWEYIEIACIDKGELVQLLKSAKKLYHGEIFSLKRGTPKSLTNLELSPELSKKQEEVLALALEEGYYEYPRKITLPELAGQLNKSYSTFQEHLSKAEGKLVSFFLRYR